MWIRAESPCSSGAVPDIPCISERGYEQIKRRARFPSLPVPPEGTEEQRERSPDIARSSPRHLLCQPLPQPRRAPEPQSHPLGRAAVPPPPSQLRVPSRALAAGSQHPCSRSVELTPALPSDPSAALSLGIKVPSCDKQREELFAHNKRCAEHGHRNLRELCSHRSGLGRGAQGNHVF